MINFVDKLNSEIPTLISTKACLKLLDQYITFDLFEKHRDDIENVLVGKPRTKYTLKNIVDDLFIKKYVNHNQSGTCSSTADELDLILRENLPEHFQALQMLSKVYNYIRINKFS